MRALISVSKAIEIISRPLDIFSRVLEIFHNESSVRDYQSSVWDTKYCIEKNGNVIYMPPYYCTKNRCWRPLFMNSYAQISIKISKSNCNKCTLVHVFTPYPLFCHRPSGGFVDSGIVYPNLSVFALTVWGTRSFLCWLKYIGNYYMKDIWLYLLTCKSQ